MLFDRLDHHPEPSSKHLIQRETLVDPVVCETVLRKVVGTNALAAIARPHQRATLGGPLFVLNTSPQFIEPSLEHSQCLGQIFVLALFVLALHN